MPMKAAMIAVVLAVLLAVGGIVFQISPVTAASPGGDASDSSHGDDGILKPVGPAFVQLPPMRMPVDSVAAASNRSSSAATRRMPARRKAAS
mgnify:CR=1 FL=1